MPRELVSKRTRREFREWLVGWVLREIADLFDDEGVRHVTLPPESLPSGQRRSLVEEYYASVDWTDPIQVRRVLNVYEHILRTLSPESENQAILLRTCLERDGYVVESSRIIPRDLGGNLEAAIRASGVVNLQHLESYVERVRASVESDPELAIGSTKELVEATLKTVLDHLEVSYATNDDIPALLRKTQIALELAPAEVDSTKKAAETIRRILGSAGAIVVGLAELRNHYGSGHGRARRTGIQPRHAKLAAGVGATLCSFLLETLDERERLHREAQN